MIRSAQAVAKALHAAHHPAARNALSCFAWGRVRYTGVFTGDGRTIKGA